MALKQRKRGTKPIKLKDAISLYPIDRSQYEGLYLRYSDFEGNEQHPGCWPQMTETEQELAHILTATDSIHYYSNILQMPYILINLYNNFGERYLLSKFYEYIDTWDGTNSDMHSISDSMQDELFRCIKINRYKWTKLYESTIAEFNPLYNVDATEETTRTLEQDGTVSNQKSGTETSKKSGTETSAKSGTETSARTGTEQTVTDEETADRKTGTETSAKTGSEQISYDTEEKTDYDGSEATTHQKAETTTESVTTTESSTFFDTKKTQDVGAANDNVDTLEYSTDRADTLSKTGTETTSFNNRQDQTTYNTTDTITHDNEVTTTHNTQDQLTHNTTDQLTHNTTDQLTHNTTDTESRDLLDTEHILHRRYGNIGITMSTQLLESFRSFVNYRLIDVISHDIADYITQGVY